MIEKHTLTFLLHAAFLLFALVPSTQTLGGLATTAALYGLCAHLTREKDNRLLELRRDLEAQLVSVKDKVDSLMLRGRS